MGNKKRKGPAACEQQALIILAITYFRLTTIIGRTGLASEFGMGSGVSLPVWSPGVRESALPLRARPKFSLLVKNKAELDESKRHIQPSAKNTNRLIDMVKSSTVSTG